MTSTKLASKILDLAMNSELKTKHDKAQLIMDVGKLIYDNKDTLCSCTPNFHDLGAGMCAICKSSSKVN